MVRGGLVGKEKRWAVGRSVRTARVPACAVPRVAAQKKLALAGVPRRVLRLPARSSLSQCSTTPPATRFGSFRFFGCARQLHSRSLTRHPEPDWSLRSRSAEQLPSFRRKRHGVINGVILLCALGVGGTDSNSNGDGGWRGAVGGECSSGIWADAAVGGRCTSHWRT